MVMCIHTYTTLLPRVLKTEDMTVAAAIRNIIIFIFTSTCWKNEGKVNAKPIDTYVIDISTFSYGLSIRTYVRTFNFTQYTQMHDQRML